MSMAAVTALTSTSICAFADGQNSEALASAITIAKTRLDIPEELTEFSYNTSENYKTTTYNLTWSTPADADEYREVSVTVCGSLILSYFDSSMYSSKNADSHFAKLTGDALYKKAQAAVKKLNPTVADVISIDRDSLNITMYGSKAQFSFVRTKNGVPVSNDRGSIVLDKDTGDIIGFHMSWHVNASFRDSKSAISLDKAKQKYAEMIQLTPQYEFDYDGQTKKVPARLVYRQGQYGEINAFTGKKSDFSADGYYDGSNETEDAAEAFDLNRACRFVPFFQLQAHDVTARQVNARLDVAIEILFDLAAGRVLHEEPEAVCGDSRDRPVLLAEFQPDMLVHRLCCAR